MTRLEELYTPTAIGDPGKAVAMSVVEEGAGLVTMVVVA
jgi:hypothetical protein